MATRTEPLEASKVATSTLEALEGSFTDGGLQELTVQTTRGPVTIYAGPVSLEGLDRVQKLLEGEEIPLANMVDVLILLARTADGDPMFREAHRDRLLKRVDPRWIIQAAEFLGEAASASLGAAEEEAGKD